MKLIVVTAILILLFGFVSSYTHTGSDNTNSNGISESPYRKLALAYTDLFKLFLNYRENIDRITFWGVSDNDTWRNNWPMTGRTDYPLLFDRNYQAKGFVNDLVALTEQYQKLTKAKLNG